MGAALDSLNGLTLSQHRAVQEYLKNGGNGTQAYLAAYPNAQPDTARAEMPGILAKPSVQELIAQACAAEGFTPQVHLQKLAELRDKSAAAEQFSAAVKGEELRGKMARFYVTQVEENSHTEHTVRFVFEQRKTTAG